MRPSSSKASQLLERVVREERSRILASLIKAVGDFELAEDALQDAFAEAVPAWERQLPDSPVGWVFSTARRRAIDRVRRRSKGRDVNRSMAALVAMEPSSYEQADPDSLNDDQLRLIFTCCHPALAEEARVALTLHTLCGLTTEQIAAAFLVPVPTMAQRLVRAKRKIRDAGVPYRVPPRELLPERIDSVRTTIYLVFNDGYSSGPDEPLRVNLAAQAIRLAALLDQLMPDEPETMGLLALMLLHESRREARFEPAGSPILLDDQDRSLWNTDLAERGRELIKRALPMGRIGRFQLEAAIAAVHSEAAAPAETDWPQIVALYDLLARVHRTPVVALNRAVAISMSGGPSAALAELEKLADDPQLAQYHLYHSARGNLLAQAGRADEAVVAYREALAVAPTDSVREFISSRLARLLD